MDTRESVTGYAGLGLAPRPPNGNPYYTVPEYAYPTDYDSGYGIEIEYVDTSNLAAVEAAIHPHQAGSH